MITIKVVMPLKQILKITMMILTVRITMATIAVIIIIIMLMTK